MINTIKQEYDAYTRICEQKPLPTLSPLTTAIKAAIIGIGLAQSTGQAATIEVNSNLDDGTDCTLRDAITSVNEGQLIDGCVNTAGAFGVDDTINVATTIAGSTVTLAGSNLDIYSGLTINAAGLTVDANLSSRVMSILRVPTISTINNIIIKGGIGNNAGINIDDSIVNITASTISDNFNNGNSGGGISIEGSESIVSISDSTVSDNSVGNYNGGGINVSDGAVVHITNTVVSGNDIDYGSGAGIAVNGTATVNLINSTISNNTLVSSESNGGGGISVEYNSTVNITNSIVSNNSATGIGLYNSAGGIDVYDSTLNIVASTIFGNSADANVGRGAGISTSSGVMTVSNSESVNLTV